MIKESSPEKKASTIAYDYLKGQILSGELTLGSRLPAEREIASALNISRNPVREAIRMLEMMGFIESIQGSGNYICSNIHTYVTEAFTMQLTLHDTSYSDLFHTRRSLEMSALSLTIERATKESLLPVRDTLLEMEKELSIHNSAKLDAKFHRQLTELSQNPILISFSEITSNLNDIFITNIRASILANPKRAEALRTAHWDIYQSLENKDVFAMVTAMNNHYDIVEEYMKKMQKKLQTPC